jgi:uncharacterized protein YifN (PemK superfamily)
MPIREHPEPGTILVCDFNAGFREPEMVKRRPVVVVSPKISIRAGLCTVVALSTTPPSPVMSYHCELVLDPPLPEPWNKGAMWVKGDMIVASGSHRLDFIRTGKNELGERVYREEQIPADDLRRVRSCILSALGLASLTIYLS